MFPFRANRFRAVSAAATILTAGLVAWNAPVDAQDSTAVPAPVSFFKGNLRLHFAPDMQKGSKRIAETLAAMVRSAKQTVDVAVFDIDEPLFVEALLERHRRGVKVRVVMDSENENEHNEPLRKARVVVMDDRKPFMHTKLVVVDGVKVYAGSANVTTLAFEKEDNNVLFFESREIGARVSAFMDQAFGEKLFGNDRTPAPDASDTYKVGTATVELLFAPEDKPLERVVTAIKEARRSVRFMTFNLSHPDIVQALIDAKKRKVKVSGVVDGSLWLSGFGPSKLDEAGIDVNLDGNPSLMHNKVIIVDDEVVITGSFNFSEKAVKQNDEDLFVIRSKEVARAYLRSWRRIMSMSKPLPPRPAASTTPGIVGGIPE